MMNVGPEVLRLWLAVVAALLIGVAPVQVLGQDDPAEAQDLEQEEAQAQEEEGDEGDEDRETVEEEIVVTGSRIATSPLSQRAPVVQLDEITLERSGKTNLGDALQQLPSMGSAINKSFNVPGNAGVPQDGNGIGAGAIEVSLRNLGAKRTLVLVDGRRWIAGASASGVPVAVDLNTIPANVIERIEVLQDGASAIYGSDAIGGVINIITKKGVEGMHVDLQGGQYASDGDGESTLASALWGTGNDETRIVVSAAYYDEQGIHTSDRAQSAFPTPFATSCLAGGCSAFTPQGTFVLGPAFGTPLHVITLDDGVLNDGGANKPVFDPNNPSGGDFHAFTAADRFNFNQADF
ncbi:MAG TPA: TonB-dependent receptor plug domain-containing protein, partial [Thermoanaerobaculia bacterium]|nr:TonB-dependent receptor plug domain-containing protein [Thermoanaerobaculia bacterium]